MNKFIDITGQRFGRLLVLEITRKDKHGQTVYKCLCDCGNTVVVIGNSLKRGHTKSCGCLSIEKTKKRATKHGLYRHPLYKLWQNIKKRCFNTKNPDYKRYGGRGVTFYEGWKNNPEAFINYIISLYPNWQELLDQGYTLDRIDNNKGYEPGNIRLATKQEQNRNRRDNLWIEFRGERMLLLEAWEKYSPEGLTYKAVYKRVHKRNWITEDAVLLPPGSRIGTC